jgi:hypothetical protein
MMMVAGMSGMHSAAFVVCGPVTAVIVSVPNNAIGRVVTTVVAATGSLTTA